MKTDLFIEAQRLIKEIEYTESLIINCKEILKQTSNEESSYWAGELKIYANNESHTYHSMRIGEELFINVLKETLLEAEIKCKKLMDEFEALLGRREDDAALH